MMINFRIHLYTSIVENAISMLKYNKEVFNQGNPNIIKSLKEGLPIFPFFFNKSSHEIIDSINILVKDLNEKLFIREIKINNKDLVGGNSSLDISKKEQVEYVIEQLLLWSSIFVTL